MKRDPKHYYTVYLKKNDELVAYGTSEECAEQMGKSVDSFYCLVSRVNSGKIKKYEIFTDDCEEIEKDC